MTDLASLNIKYLPGVGPKRAELLNKELEIFTYLDLLHYYPYKYIDRSKTYKINEIDGSMPYIQLRGKIVSYTTHGEGARRRLTALFSDGSGVIELGVGDVEFPVEKSGFPEKRIFRSRFVTVCDIAYSFEPNSADIPGRRNKKGIQAPL